MTFYLKDTFSIDVGAGLVNGTPADVGGNRTAVDTNSKISITGGKLNFATGAVNNDAIRYPIQARVAGKILKATTVHADTNGNIRVGYDTDTTISFYDYLYFSGGNISVMINLAFTFIISIYTATTYQVIQIMRANGMFWFIKGGAFTYWTFLSSSRLGLANLYPGISIGNNTTIATADDIKIPPTLWLPAPLASDGFSDVDEGETDGLGHPEGVIGGLGAGGDGLWWPDATWVTSGGLTHNHPTLGLEQNSGTLTVGKWYSITATEANYFYTGSAIGDTFRALAATALDANNKVKEITLATLFRALPIANANIKVRIACSAFLAGTQFGVAARVASDKTSGIVLDWDGQGNIKLVEYSGSTTWSALMSVVKAYAAGNSIELDLSGTAFRCYHITAAGVTTLLGSGTCTVDGSLGTDAGIFSTDPTNTGDNFVVYAKGTANEYAVLDYIVDDEGVLTKTLDTITIVATGLVITKGVLAGTLDAIGIVATGKQTGYATLSKTLDSVGLLATGIQTGYGVLAKTLDDIGLVTTGIQIGYGVLTKTLDTVGLTAAGIQIGYGLLAKTLDGIGLTAAGIQIGYGVLSKTLSPITIAATGITIYFINLGKVEVNLSPSVNAIFEEL